MYSYKHASAVSIYTYEFPLYNDERGNQLEVQNELRFKPIVYNYFRLLSKSIVGRLSEAKQESHLSNQKLRVSEHKHIWRDMCPSYCLSLFRALKCEPQNQGFF